MNSPRGAGKAAFEKLRDLLARKHDVKSRTLLEDAAQNPGYAAAIKGDLAKPDIAKDAEVLDLAETLRAAIEALPEPVLAAPPAIDAEVIRAGGNQLFEAVEGIRAGRIEATGDQTFKGIKSPGK